MSPRMNTEPRVSKSHLQISDWGGNLPPPRPSLPHSLPGSRLLIPSRHNKKGSFSFSRTVSLEAQQQNTRTHARTHTAHQVTLISCCEGLWLDLLEKKWFKLFLSAVVHVFFLLLCATFTNKSYKWSERNLLQQTLALLNKQMHYKFGEILCRLKQWLMWNRIKQFFCGKSSIFYSLSDLQTPLEQPCMISNPK